MRKGLLCRIKHSSFDGDNYVGSMSHVVNAHFGYMTYCGSRCRLINVRIGSYCSIASDVRIINGSHPTQRWISTHPAFYSTNTPTRTSFVSETKYDEYRYVIPEKRISVTIGNDVWVGSDAMILENVRIADGAIIAAGALVTKDVSSYCIVGGVPARKIGQRFSDVDINFLLENKWWDKDIQWIKKNAWAMNDISCYKAVLEKESTIE